MELTRRASSRTDRAEDARRARLILLLAEGHTWDEVSERIDCSRGFVASWTKRFTEQRIAGLYSRHLGQVATVLTPELEARILEATRRAPTGGATHWSTRKLGGHLDVSHMMVARVWRKHGLQPHRIERYMVIHVIADNLSAHKRRPVTDFLAVHPKAHLHFTPTYSSWLNQVELWFGKIERDVIARGVFTSVSDLKRKLLRYIRQYNKSPRTVKWKYADPLRHISI
jgi:transposase